MTNHTKWDGSGSPIEDIKRFKEAIMKQAHHIPDVAIVSPLTYKLLTLGKKKFRGYNRFVKRMKKLG